MMRYRIVILFLILCNWVNLWADPAIIDPSAPVFTFCMPEMAGQLTFGIIKDDKSKWLTDTKVKLKENKKNRFVYELTDPLLEKGCIWMRVARLSESDGVILEIEGEGLPDDIRLLWSYAGACGEMLSAGEAIHMKPEYCIYNVYSVEHTAFTLYYGESMKLKVIQAVMPVTSDIRLSDYSQRETPLAYYNSGKKTDYPALSGVLPLKSKEKEYICVYRQNDRADYNHFMLPGLFIAEFNQ